MKQFAWNGEKNDRLKTERDIFFEEVVQHIEQGAMLAILEHPNPSRYPSQRIFVVHMYNYAWLVPFVEDENQVFLKTIIPSRKATRQYLGRPSDDADH